MNVTSSSYISSTSGETEVDVLNVMMTRYTTAAGVAILVYDCLLTIGDEIRLVWPGPLTVAKLLYYLNRYVSIVGIIMINYVTARFRQPLSSNSCRFWLGVTGILQLMTSFTSAALPCLRVAALYDQTKWVQGVLWAALILCYAGTMALLGSGYSSVWQTITYSSVTHFCLPSVHSHIYVVYLSPLALDALVIALIVIKAYKNSAALRSASGTPILSTLIRDSFCHALSVALMRACNVIIWITQPTTMMYLVVYMNWALVVTLISRFFLNLRAVAHDNPLLLPRGTTGFALDNTTLQMLVVKIMRRKPANLNSNLNAARSSVDLGARHHLDGTDMIGPSRDHVPTADVDSEARRECVESRNGENGHSPV